MRLSLLSLGSSVETTTSEPVGPPGSHHQKRYARGARTSHATRPVVAHSLDLWPTVAAPRAPLIAPCRCQLSATGKASAWPTSRPALAASWASSACRVLPCQHCCAGMVKVTPSACCCTMPEWHRTQAKRDRQTISAMNLLLRAPCNSEILPRARVKLLLNLLVLEHCANLLSMSQRCLNIVCPANAAG